MMLDVAEAVSVRPDCSAIVNKCELSSSDMITGKLGIGEGLRPARGQGGAVEAMESLG
jgi:hypothetical protein